MDDLANNNWALKNRKHSSGHLPALQSDNKAISDTSTLEIVNAGDHLSFKTSRQITP